VSHYEEGEREGEGHREDVDQTHEDDGGVALVVVVEEVGTRVVSERQEACR
jgi:hypothetical protein